MSILTELKRRNVHRVAIAYVAAAWLIIQVAETLLPVFGASPNALRTLVILLAIGFFPAMVLAWRFEWTPSGIVRDSPGRPSSSAAPSKGLDRAITLVLVAAVAYFAVDKFVLSGKERIGDKSIAVMPFDNIGGGDSSEFLAVGLPIELTNLFASIPRLRVVASNTTETFRETDFDPVEAASKMNVNHLLVGSVRRADERIRVAVQLIRPDDQTQLWSQIYERSLEDVFTIQDDIAARVVGHLRIPLSGEPPTSKQINPRAYERYIEGHHLTHTVRTRDAFVEAERLLEQVVEMEPAYVPALWSLARAVFNLGDYSDPNERQRRLEYVDELVARMVEIAPDSSYANGWLAAFAARDGDLQASAHYRERAIAGGTDTNVYQQLAASAWLLSVLGRTEESIPLAKYVVARDPACTACVYQLAFALRTAGQHREAAIALEKLADWRELAPNIAWSAGVAWLVAGEPGRALEHFDSANEEGSMSIGRAMALHDLGRTEEFQELFTLMRSNAHEHPEGIARIAAWTGQADLAFEYLDLMIEEDDSFPVASIRTDLYEPIKSDPRWQVFLDQHGASDDDLDEIEFNPKLPDEVLATISRAQADGG